MSTTQKMAAAQEAVLKASTLAEAQSILDRMKGEEQAVADTFFTQEQTIADLQKMLQATGQKVTYIEPAAPQTARPNYLLYIGIGVLVLILFGKVKL